MIVGVGCDLISLKLTKELHWGTNSSIQRRIFSKKELDAYLTNCQISFLGSRFAVKEAVLKCLGIGMQDGILLTEIETLDSGFGVPELNLYGTIKRLSDRMQINHWRVSISFTNDISIALVIAEN